jgi:hypothetical protein
VVSVRAGGDPLESVPMRLTYRTARVLEGVAENPDGSNRRVAEFAGIHDPGQVSKLLRRLERIGLLTNGGLGHLKGAPNAWKLTVKGERIAQSIRVHGRYESEAGERLAQSIHAHSRDVSSLRQDRAVKNQSRGVIPSLSEEERR